MPSSPSGNRIRSIAPPTARSNTPAARITAPASSDNSRTAERPLLGATVPATAALPLTSPVKVPFKPPLPLKLPRNPVRAMPCEITSRSSDRVSAPLSPAPPPSVDLRRSTDPPCIATDTGRLAPWPVSVTGPSSQPPTRTFENCAVSSPPVLFSATCPATDSPGPSSSSLSMAGGVPSVPDSVSRPLPAADLLHPSSGMRIPSPRRSEVRPKVVAPPLVKASSNCPCPALLNAPLGRPTLKASTKRCDNSTDPATVVLPFSAGPNFCTHSASNGTPSSVPVPPMVMWLLSAFSVSASAASSRPGTSTAERTSLIRPSMA